MSDKRWDKMSNQDILDAVVDALPRARKLPCKEKILDAVWQILNDERKEPDAVKWRKR